MQHPFLKSNRCIRICIKHAFLAYFHFNYGFGRFSLYIMVFLTDTIFCKFVVSSKIQNFSPLILSIIKIVYTSRITISSLVPEDLIAPYLTSDNQTDTFFESSF